MKKDSKNTITIIIIISFLIVLIVFTIIKDDKEAEKNRMLFDAQQMLINADAQKSLDEVNNKKTTCLYVYGYDGLYNNSGNYVGSIDLTEEKPYIELSDGNYLIKGTYDDLIMVESNLTASTSCNR